MNSLYIPAFALCVAFAVSGTATAVLIPLLRRNNVLDLPNSRSSHIAPTPRGGGIGLVLGLAAVQLVALPLGAQMLNFRLLMAALLVAMCGLADDIYGLPALLRLGIQCAAAMLAISGSGSLDRFPLPAPFAFGIAKAGAVLSVLWVVGVTNIFNFLDGIDGFAGMQGLLAGLALGIFAEGNVAATLGFGIAGACAGFLVHNWHPAKVFMGDIGSTTIGFLLAAAPLQLPRQARSQGVFCMVLFLWFFLSDGSFTLIRRLLAGERVWRPHRSHCYQRLVIGGLRHDSVVCRVGLMTIVITSLALVSAIEQSSFLEWAALLTAIALFVFYARWSAKLDRLCNVGGGLRPSRRGQDRCAQ